MFWRTHAPYLLKRPPRPHIIAPISVGTLAKISKYPNSVTQLHNSIDNGSLSVAYELQITNQLIN